MFFTRTGPQSLAPGSSTHATHPHSRAKPKCCRIRRLHNKQHGKMKAKTPPMAPIAKLPSQGSRVSSLERSTGSALWRGLVCSGELGTFGPLSCEFGPEIGQTCSKLPQHWSNSREVGTPTSTESEPALTIVGPNSTMLCPSEPRSNGATRWPNSAKQ